MKKRKLPTSNEEREARKEKFFAAFQVESDRGCVLVATAVLDELIEAVLRKAMSSEEDVVKRGIQPLFSTAGPLGSFWAKIQLLYAFGYLTKQSYDDLQIIREIRNYFAHHYGSADFDDPEIINLCERLKAADLAVQAFAKKDSDLAPSREHSSAAEPRRRASDRVKKERLRFTLSVSYLAGSLDTYSNAPQEIVRTLHTTPL
jgi:DNA-binding MltR family transcriptional regulator